MPSFKSVYGGPFSPRWDVGALGASEDAGDLAHRGKLPQEAAERNMAEALAAVEKIMADLALREQQRKDQIQWIEEQERLTQAMNQQYEGDDCPADDEEDEADILAYCPSHDESGAPSAQSGETAEPSAREDDDPVARQLAAPVEEEPSSATAC